MEKKQQIQNSAKEFMKSGNNIASDALRMVLAAMTSKEKEKRYKISKEKPDLKEENLIKASELTNDEVINILLSEVKKRKDAIVLYEKGNRQELADKEKKEIEILQQYLPEQISAEELKKIVKDSVNKTGAKEMKDMGRIMADLMPKVKGKADLGEISKIIKGILSE